MARIAGVNIPSAKRVVIALTYIHGIGNAKAQEIIDKADIGWSMTTVMSDARDGQGQFAGKPTDKILYIANFYPKAVITARVFLSAPQVPILLKTLTHSWQTYQAKLQQPPQAP